MSTGDVSIWTANETANMTTGELSPHHAHCVTLYHNDLTCEADTLGSCGYATPAEILQSLPASLTGQLFMKRLIVGDVASHAAR